jgi:hypothetical protein
MDWSLIVGGHGFATEGMACVSAANKMRTAHMALTRGTARVTHADSENGIIVIERHYEGPDENGTQINERLIVEKSEGKLVFRAPGFSIHFARGVVLPGARDETVAGRMRCASMKDSPAGCFLIENYFQMYYRFN